MVDVYLKSANIYRGDYSCILYSRDYEFTPGGHYHDFYEVQFYLQDAGSILIGDQEYPLRGGEILCFSTSSSHTMLNLEMTGPIIKDSVYPWTVISCCRPALRRQTYCSYSILKTTDILF